MIFTIHFGSLLLGLIIGTIFTVVVVSAVLFSDDGLWSLGFGDGFKAGVRSERKEWEEE